MGDEKKSVVNLARDFAEDTSMHGVSKVVSKRSLVRKIFWLLVTLTAFSVATYNIVNVVNTYISRPVATVMSIEHNTKLRFPSITFCNLNPVRKSKFSNTSTPALVDLAVILGLQKITKPADPEEAEEQEDFLEEFMDVDPDDQFTIANAVAGIISGMDARSKKDMGHQLEDMMLFCQFGGEACSASDFDYAYNEKYGNCYTFNSKGLSESSQTGPQYGLTLEFYIEEAEYIGLLADTVGMKVLVTEPSQAPFPSDEGLVVGPGQDTHIGLSMRQIIRASPPHGDCETEPKEEVMEIIRGWGQHFLYSNRACMRACLQIHTITSCDCCNPILPCSDEIFQKVLKNNDVKSRLCRLVSVKTPTAQENRDMKCTVDVFWKYVEDELECSKTCNPPCSETSFPSEYSTGLWPTSSVIKHTKQKIVKLHNVTGSKGKYNSTADVSEDFITRNTLKLHIFYKLLNHEVVLTEPSYDEEKLISDIGGSGGLWLGFSVLTFLEIVELLVDILLNACKSSKNTPVQPFQGK